ADWADTVGTSYLRWAAGDQDVLSTWGYFDVYSFAEDDTLINFDAGPVAGVHDMDEPPNGYYNNSTMFVLTFGSGK
ncbi:MAG: hypothetical protein ACPGTU_11865, partial [Myxococcota bacterium]